MSSFCLFLFAGRSQSGPYDIASGRDRGAVPLSSSFPFLSAGRSQIGPYDIASERDRGGGSFVTFLPLSFRGPLTERPLRLSFICLASMKKGLPLREAFHGGGCGSLRSPHKFRLPHRLLWRSPLRAVTYRTRFSSRTGMKKGLPLRAMSFR